MNRCITSAECRYCKKVFEYKDSIKRVFCKKECRILFQEQKKSKTVEIKCNRCGKIFLSRKASCKLCSPKCRRPVRDDFDDPILVKNRGAWGESLICMDLLERKFEVYKNINTGGKRQLIAIRGKTIITVQIRCGTKDKNGVVRYSLKEDGAGCAEYTAVYIRKTRELFYYPELS